MKPIDLPALITSRFDTPDGQCQQFLLCENDATTTREHSILGAVPICDRCNDKMDRIEALR